jgi:hypothetical protein
VKALWSLTDGLFASLSDALAQGDQVIRGDADSLDG